MKSTFDNSVNFTSHYKIINQHIMSLLQRYTPKDCRIVSYDIPDKSAYLLGKNVIATSDVRTCTAGLVIDSHKKLAELAMHIKNTDYNLNNLSVLTKHMKGTNAFLAGAKTNFGDVKFEYAKEVMEILKRKLRTLGIKTTRLEGLNGDCGLDMAYCGKKDTVFLALHKIIPKKEGKFEKEPIPVNNFEDLKKYFRKIRIAQGDYFEFNSKASLQDLIDYYSSL